MMEIWLCPECDMIVPKEESDVQARGTCRKCGNKQAMLIRLPILGDKGFEHP